MFSKIVNHIKHLSIAARLSILYALTSFLMLLMLSIYAYWALTDTLSNANEKFLTDEVKVFRNILFKHPDNHNLLAEEVEWVPEELEASEYHYYARISDANKNIYAITKGMTNIFNGVNFPTPAKTNETPEETDVWVSPTGNTYLLISAYAKMGKTNDLRLVEIALDISSQQQIIAKYRYNLLFVLILGIVCATLLGVWVARKGMRSLNDITQYAKDISISNLDAMSIKQCPKELHDLVHAFNNMLLRIENAIKKLSLFSNELAHELRTPINNLMGEAEIILSKERLVEEYKEVISSSLEEYLRISKTIETILFMARTENPGVKLQFKEIDLKTEFEEIAENFEPLLNEKKITLTRNGNEKLFAEPNLLRRTLNNLISNSIRYTQIGGNITLTCRQLEKEIAILVEDDGIGIAEEHIPFIFDRFYRVKEDELSSNYGLGLGLSIVKAIMDLHKGTIKLHSHVRRGTQIYLIFPLAS